MRRNPVDSESTQNPLTCGDIDTAVCRVALALLLTRKPANRLPQLGMKSWAKLRMAIKANHAWPVGKRTARDPVNACC